MSHGDSQDLSTLGVGTVAVTGSIVLEELFIGFTVSRGVVLYVVYIV